METYLGLDIGTYSIKASILSLSFSENRILETRERKIAYGPDIDPVTAKAEALKALLSGLQLPVLDAVYANLGAQHTVTKRFDLTNVRRKDRQKIIEGEFDLLGLFNLEDYSLEYHTIEFGTSQSRILGILINKFEAKHLIDVLALCELNVRVIDIDTLTLLNLFPFLPPSAQPSYELFVDCGHSKTGLTVVHKNKVVYTHSIPLAGQNLTDRIKTQLNLSEEEAQDLKHAVASAAKRSDVESICTSFFEEIAIEIKRILILLYSTDGLKVEHIFVLGGTSNCPALNDMFEKHLDTTPQRITLENRNLKFVEAKSIDFSVFAQSLAVSFRGNLNAVNSKINIRHGPLALSSNYDKIINEFLRYFKLSAIFALVFFGSYMLRYILFQNRINEIKSQFKKEIVNIFKTEPKELAAISGRMNWDFSEYSNRAIKLIQEDQARKSQTVENFSAVNAPIPLKILNQMSLAIPKDIPFEVVHLKYQEDVLFFEADTIDNKSVDAIMDRLNQIKLFENVTKKSQVAKPGSDGNVVHFAVTARITHKKDE